MTTKKEQHLRYLASSISSLLRIDKKSIPYLTDIFERINPTEKTGKSMLKLGHFQIIVQHSEQHEISEPFLISIVAVDLVKKEYVKGIKLQIVENSSKEVLAEGITNRQGWSSISIDTSDFLLEKGLEIVASDSRTSEEVSLHIKPCFYHRKSIKRSETWLYMITDKKLYKPGEMLRFFGICWADFDGCYVPLSDKLIEEGVFLKFRNLKKKVLFQKIIEPNEHGLLWGEIPIVENLAEGQYTLELEFRDNHATETYNFEVKAYTRPEIELDYILDEEWVINIDPDSKNDYHINAAYYYGAPVKNATIKCAIKEAEFYDQQNQNYLIVSYYQILLGETETDEKGMARLSIELSEQIFIELLSKGWNKSGIEIPFDQFLDDFKKGNEVTLIVEILIEDQQGRTLQKEHRIRCVRNIFSLSNHNIHLLDREEGIIYSAQMTDHQENNFNGEVEIEIKDRQNILVGLKETRNIKEGEIEIGLLPRAALGIAPHIQLIGTLRYQYGDDTIELTIEAEYGERSLEGFDFEIRASDKLAKGQKTVIKISSKNYRGPFLIHYGKYEVFQQISGMITEEEPTFSHELIIPKPYVGQIACNISIFDFGNTGELITVEKELNIDKDSHLLSYKVEIPEKAEPGEIIELLMERNDQSTERWDWLLKLSDKSLRGLDATTEFKLEDIYALSQKLRLTSKQPGSEDIQIILSDLAVMMQNALKKSDYDPNFFISMLELDAELKDTFPKYYLIGQKTRALMNRYFLNLRGETEALVSFFSKLREKNLDLAGAYLGSFFFPKSTLNISNTSDLYRSLAKYSDTNERINPNSAQIITDYLNIVVLECFEDIVKHTYLNFLRTGDDIISIGSLLNKLNDFIKFLIQLSDTDVISFSKDQIKELREFHDIFTNRNFLRKLFINRYWLDTSNKQRLKILRNDYPILREYNLLDDNKVMKSYLDEITFQVNHLEWTLDNYIEVEEDDLWDDLKEIHSNLQSLKLPNFALKIDDIVKFLFSENFFQQIFEKRCAKIPLYECMEEEIMLINSLKATERKNYYIGTILDQTLEKMDDLVNYYDLDKIIPKLLYHNWEIKKILKLIDWTELSKKLIEKRNKIQDHLVAPDYFLRVLHKILSHKYFELYNIPCPSTFLEDLNLWYNRLVNKGDYDFTQIGFNPDEDEIVASEVFTGLFGDNVTKIYQLYCLEIAKCFQFQIRKGKYKNFRDYISLLEGWKEIGNIYFELREFSSENNEELKQIHQIMNSVDEEGLFKVFYLYYLNLLKKGDIHLGCLYSLKKLLDLLCAKDPQKNYSLKKDNEPIEHIFNLTQDFSHFNNDWSKKFIYVLIYNFLNRVGFKYYPVRKDSSLLEDYSYFEGIYVKIRGLLNEMDYEDQEGVDELIRLSESIPSFEEYWSDLEISIYMIFPDYILNTLDALENNAQKSLSKTIFRSIAKKIRDIFSENPLIGLFWVSNPKEIPEYHKQWRSLLNRFENHPLGNEFKESIGLMEYYFIHSEQEIIDYFASYLKQFKTQEFPYIMLSDYIWYGKQQALCFPNIIGYPKYMSIMTDVEHYGSNITMKFTKKSEDVSEKKRTIRKDFRDIGYYEIIPQSNKSKITRKIKLPDSITTQEMHVASFGQNCRMNYKIKEVQVVQEFFLKDDLPEQLILNDEISANVIITNTSKESMRVSLDFKMETIKRLKPSEEKGINIQCKEPLEFHLDPNGIENVNILITAKDCGVYLVRLVAESENYYDEVQKEIKVVAGFPSDIEQHFEFINLTQKEKENIHEINIDIPPNFIDFNCALSVYPNLTSHIIDGVEANLQYPYGCVEQVFSALMPNLVYYDYLCENRNLSRETKTKIENNIINGYLKLQSNQKYDGGFGWWAETQNSDYITALVLFAYKFLYKHDYLGETFTIGQVVNYLLNESLNKATFEWHLHETEVERRSILSKFTDKTLTVFILFSLNQIKEIGLMDKSQEYLFLKAVEGIKSIDFTQITDCNMLFFLLELYSTYYVDAVKPLVQHIMKFNVSPYWLGGSSIGGDVETTAKLAKSLWEKGFMKEKLRDEILEWIYSQKAPYGGWRNTSSTRAVVEFLTGLLSHESGDFILTIECNEETILENDSINSENISEKSYQLQYIPLHKYLKSSSEQEENKLMIKIRGLGRPMLKLVQEKWIEKDISPLKGLSITRYCEQASNELFDEITINLEFQIPDELDQMIVVEEPLLPAAMVNERSINQLLKEGKIIGTKRIDSKMAFFIPPGNKQHILKYEIIPNKEFRGTQAPSSIYPMYQPYKIQYGNTTTFNFKKKRF